MNLPQVAETNTPRPMDATGECLLYDEFMLGIWKVKEISMHRHLCIAALWAMILALLTLAACVTIPPASPAPAIVIVLGTPVEINDQATLAAALTQDQNNADIQAKGTAEIMRANAQATLDSANATLSAAQIQQKNSADAIAAQAMAAQMAAAAAIVRANAQATLVAADSTRSAALTQDAIQQTQAQYDLQSTEAVVSTQTAAANLIATQTQSALATSQWYADQARRRQEQIQGPITFLWVWCLPIFLLILAVLVVWGLWRWLKIKQANQRILENPDKKLPAPIIEVIDPQHDDPSRYLEGDVIDRHYRLTKPVDQARRWLDEVKRKLLSSDEKDEDDSSDD